MVIHKRFVRAVALCSVVGSLGCSDLLDVSDPSAFTDADLDKALDAVARGVEGGLHGYMDNANNLDAIISDLFKHTGTWIGWDDIDHGIIDFNGQGSSDGGSGLLQTRAAAQDAIRRFERLEGDGETIANALWAQVLVSEGWTDLLLGQWFCESVTDPVVDESGVVVTYGEPVPDTEMWGRAVTKLNAALSKASGTDFALWAQAGLARANLFLGNLSEANAAAANVIANAPAGWQKLALFQISTLENSIVNLSTIGFNNASGFREKWWSYFDDAAGLMANPWSQEHLGLTELDPRLQVKHIPGVLGVDGETDYHSQWKYQDVGADIRITHVNEMRLIQAEVAMRNSQFTEARTILNSLRTAAGLTPAPDAMADDLAEVQELLLNERFSELYLEGQREIDLIRFGLIADLMAAGDFVGTAPTRTVKFPITRSEAIDNPNVEDNSSARCLPQVTTN